MEGTIRRDIHRNKFETDEVEKAGPNWLITREAVKRVYLRGGNVNKIVYWTDEKTGACVELAGTKWDGDLSDEELLAKAREVAEQEGMDLSYGEIVIEIEEEAN